MEERTLSSGHDHGKGAISTAGRAWKAKGLHEEKRSKPENWGKLMKRELW